MVFIINTPKAIPSSEITPEPIYLSRRDVLKTMGVSALAISLPSMAHSAASSEWYTSATEAQTTPLWLKQKIAGRLLQHNKPVDVLTPYPQVSTYNNFYEFGFEKSDPAKFEQSFHANPWSIEISGEVEKPGIYHLEDFIKPHLLEDRIYRFRCVEAWSMVVPWLGFPLQQLIARVNPTSKARYVAFTTLEDKQQFPEQKTNSVPWPYVEGLRLDEAKHPLALMAVGLYGRSLPAQNGAPLRLIVPWKYGFKSIKSIVKINFVAEQPPTTWNQLAANEYGFFANVNPQVDHPRWSQQRERRLPNSLFNPNWKETLAFNGYAKEVAGLYTGMNLTTHF